jgi:APA family basic amino acid/polyamine antiporter
MNIFRKITPEVALQNAKDDNLHKLRKDSLSWYHLAFMCVGIIGAGLFTVGAEMIAKQAGPSTIISFLIAAAVCGLAALCFAEFSTVIPLSGSSYTYSYTAFGEIIAWIIGWDLILEYFFASSLVSKVWGGYFVGLIKDLTGNQSFSSILQLGDFKFDWAPAILIILVIGALIKGVNTSSTANNVFVIIKIAIVLVIIVAGIQFFNIANLNPFIPDQVASLPSDAASDWESRPLLQLVTGASASHFGVAGILSAAAIVIFSFLGFESAASSAEETKDPKKNVPKGLFIGLLIITVLFVVVTFVLSGMVSHDEWQQIAAAGDDVNIASAFKFHNVTWISIIVEIGVIIGITSVVLVAAFALSRTTFAMSRDKLLPPFLAKTGKNNTPYITLIVAGVAMVLMSCFFDITFLLEMVNIGTLSAFVLVSFGIPKLRKREQELGIKSESFKVPFSPILPIISGCACLFMMINLATFTWVRFGVWLAVGIGIYVFYGNKHSKLADGNI